MTKVCTGCGAELPLDSFYVERRGLHGRRGECKSCISAKRRARYQENPALYRARSLQWARSNPEKVLTNVRRRRELLRAARGSHTQAEWRAVLDAAGGRCLACGTTERVGVDHVVPISAGGTDDIDNIQPLCVSCNSKKNVQSVDYRDGVFPTLAAEEVAA